jgi:hypothetical protein
LPGRRPKAVAPLRRLRLAPGTVAGCGAAGKAAFSSRLGFWYLPLASAAPKAGPPGRGPRRAGASRAGASRAGKPAPRRAAPRRADNSTAPRPPQVLHCRELGINAFVVLEQYGWAGHRVTRGSRTAHPSWKPGLPGPLRPARPHAALIHACQRCFGRWPKGLAKSHKTQPPARRPAHQPARAPPAAPRADAASWPRCWTCPSALACAPPSGCAPS